MNIHDNVHLTMHIAVTQAAEGAEFHPGDDTVVLASMELASKVPSHESVEILLESLIENAEQMFEGETYRAMTRDEVLAYLKHSRDEEND